MTSMRPAEAFFQQPVARGVTPNFSHAASTDGNASPIRAKAR